MDEPDPLVQKMENEIKELTKATLRCYLLDSTETDTAVNDSSQKGNLAIFSKAY